MDTDMAIDADGGTKINSGLEINAKDIVRGPAGAQGPQGPQGDNGTMGIQGLNHARDHTKFILWWTSV